LWRKHFQLGTLANFNLLMLNEGLVRKAEALLAMYRRCQASNAGKP
jgi:hypothetical protein